MKVMLTGATGFIGRHLHKHFQNLGWEVHTLGRVSCIEEIDRALFMYRPDVVVHLATLFIAEHKTEDVGPLIDSNIRFGTMLVDSMVRHNIKNLINTGTFWQYYNGDRETASCLYAATKTAYENVLKFYVSAYELRVVTLVMSDTYGPNDVRPKLLPKLIQIAGSDNHIDLSPGDQLVEWTHIDDVLSAYEVSVNRLNEGLEKHRFAKYSVSSGEPLSLKETVAICEKVIGKKIEVNFGAKPYRKREMMRSFGLDARLPSWTPRYKFEDGLRTCLS